MKLITHLIESRPLLFLQRKLSLLCLITLSVSVNVFCAEVTLQDIEKVTGIQAQLGKFQQIRAGAISVSDYTVREIKALKDSDCDEIIGYVSLLDPEGFVVTSKDDNITPIICYSFKENFSFKENKDNLILYMLKKDLCNRLKALTLISDDIKEENKRLWESYLTQENYEYKIQAVKQWPSGDDGGWVKTTWHQSAPYNNMCPLDGGVRSVVGCVATAMAQVVNFHQYPRSISFSAEDAYPTFTQGIVVNDFDEVNTDLAHIDYSDSLEQYAPALCFACGIIVEMDYTASSSGAKFYAENFTGKLQYKNAVRMMGNDVDFYDVLEEDMKSRRPAMIAIHQGSYAGYHAIVVDGYRTTGEYHLNYGWGDTQPDVIEECWYVLPAGMPLGYCVVEYGVLSITPPELNPYNSYEYPISYPNPFRLNEVNKVVIAMPDDPDGLIDIVRIYTSAGELVREIEGGDLYVEWDGRNDAGNRCAPGVYFYSMRTTEDENFRGKVTLLY